MSQRYLYFCCGLQLTQVFFTSWLFCFLKFWGIYNLKPMNFSLLLCSPSLFVVIVAHTEIKSYFLKHEDVALWSGNTVDLHGAKVSFQCQDQMGMDMQNLHAQCFCFLLLFLQQTPVLALNIMPQLSFTCFVLFFLHFNLQIQSLVTQKDQRTSALSYQQLFDCSHRELHYLQ